ncbi:MAG: hypothetical protein U5L11_06310 [Arhodomonas sp.]|nr:hypothetical protein [Arhodomonas sp.]
MLDDDGWVQVPAIWRASNRTAGSPARRPGRTTCSSAAARTSRRRRSRRSSVEKASGGGRGGGLRRVRSALGGGTRGAAGAAGFRATRGADELWGDAGSTHDWPGSEHPEALSSVPSAAAYRDGKIDRARLAAPA